MNTSVLNYAEPLKKRAKSANSTQRSPAHAFAGVMYILRQTMQMMQAMPDTGRISSRQLAKLRAMANRI